MAVGRIRGRTLLIGFVALFVALEIGIRVLGERESEWNIRLGVAKRFDPITLFRWKSNFHLAHGVYTNENGYLAAPGLALEKTPGKERFIYLGDSVTVLPVPGFYPTQVEEMLGASGRAIETLNAAVPGYSTRNARALLESDLSRYDGDWFFVNLGWNDLGQYGPDGLPYKLDEAGYRLNPVQRVLTQIYTIRFAYALQHLWRRATPSVDRPLTPEEESRYGAYYPTHYEENLRAILRLAKSRYPNVVIMNLATITNTSPTEHELRTAHYPTGMDRNMRLLHQLVLTYNGVVDRVSAEEGVAKLDLFALFDSEAARREFTDSCHLNRAGATRVARAITEFVQHRTQSASAR